MITSHFAIRKGKGESTHKDNSLDFILDGGKLKKGYTSRGESVINPNFFSLPELFHLESALC